MADESHARRLVRGRRGQPGEQGNQTDEHTSCAVAQTRTPAWVTRGERRGFPEPWGARLRESAKFPSREKTQMA